MSPKKTVVVGAGPVGALAAIYAAERGDDVEVYELRGDPRDAGTVPLNFTKSINLALSERGIHAMRQANRPGLLDSILAETIPMHGRMIHGQRSGELYEESQQYDVNGRFIRAADRGALNKRLLDEAESLPNVKFFFNHKLTGADFKKNQAWFETRSQKSDSPAQRLPEVQVSFDFMLGCDGAHSAVRYHLMKYTRMSYMQSYISDLWCEFHIKPSPSDDFRISPNHLHIWPAKDFMFIAIPSQDKSFTCTLFMPEARFKELDADTSSVISFFDTHFPGVARDLITDEDLVSQYKSNPHLPLISIKCSPHVTSSAVILGDAAHAMVPFYGQGMNAGLEDVRVLYSVLDKHISSPKTTPSESTTLAAALAEYSEVRTPQAHAICDLAMRNYQEMRSDVQSPIYQARKKVEEWLSVSIPSLGWATQYSRVSFGIMPYDEVIQRANHQGRVLGWWLTGLGGAIVGGSAWAALFALGGWRRCRELLLR